MLSVDPYLNETTRHADVILPPPPPSRAAHFDVALSGAVVRNNARYSPPALPLADGRPDECEILARLALIVLGMGPDADPKLVDDQVIATTLGKEVSDPTHRWPAATSLSSPRCCPTARVTNGAWT